MSLKKAIYSHLVGQYDLAFTVDAGTDVITATGHTLVDGDKFRSGSTTTLPGGLSADTDLFARDVSGSTLKAALTSGGAAIDITSAGTGTHTLGTAVTDLVAARIYPGQAPQDAALPYIVFNRISSERFPHMTSPSGLARARVQFDVYASSQLEAEDVRNALRLWLDGYDKAMGSANLDVRLVTLENEADDLLPPQDASDTGNFNIIMDFFFTYAESIPAH